MPSVLQDHGGLFAGRAVVRRGLDSGESISFFQDWGARVHLVSFESLLVFLIVVSFGYLSDGTCVSWKA